ncbi:MAG: hypothetical protein LBG59_07910 [Candidatus Peribacteria bacterium]|jgi:hypothetical protein|nr:hypothetical protein [Candidatus Peribacteria bacterium]
MQHFIRKSFTIELIFPKKFLRYRWNKKVSISVQQATIADTLEFREKTKNKQKSTYIIIAYLENFRGKKFSKDEIHYLSSQSKVLSELWEKTFLYGVIDTEPRF